MFIRKRSVVFLVLVAVCAISIFIFHQLDDKSAVDDTASRISGSELNELRDSWISVIKDVGAEKAYALFLKQAPQNTEASTHTQAHIFGEALYRMEGIDGIRVCDSSFEFGCYHSFFGQAVYEEGIQTLPLFDKACSDTYGGENLPCQHGIGHGLLVYTGYDELKAALQFCEQISWQPIGGCSSGVFMEYNFHTMESVEGEDYIRPAEEDEYAPCTLLPEKYQASCYFDQVQWWLGHSENDYAYVAKLCEGLVESDDNYRACYYGLGNYVAAGANLIPEKIASVCSVSTSNEEANVLCHEAASWLVRGNGSGFDEALQVCAFLSSPKKEICSEHLSALNERE